MNVSDMVGRCGLCETIIMKDDTYFYCKCCNNYCCENCSKDDKKTKE